MPEVVRDHDKLYLREDRKHNPKEYFKFIASRARFHLDRYEEPEIIDVGCATGDFLFYLQSQFPRARLTGLDVMPELLYRARREVQGCEFFEGDICEKDSLPRKQFDAVFMNGVHSIFYDLHPWLENVLDLVDRSNEGRAFIYGMFNPEDLDVLVQARHSSQDPEAPWQAGWNCFSKSSVGKALKQLGVDRFSFYDFEIGIDIPPNPEDPLRSWTFRYEDGSRGIINGTMMLHPFMLLEISP